MDNKKRIYTTASAKATRDLARELLPQLLKSKLICLQGNLGAGKTTFSQGLLEALGARGPYTSPTFAIMKRYPVHKTWNRNHKTNKSCNDELLHDPCSMLHDVYHIDAYRIGPDDMIDLGWEELIADKHNFFIIEWPERIRKIIPPHACWIDFRWLDEKRREISLK